MEADDSDCLSKSKHKQGDSVDSLEYANIHKLFLFVTTQLEWLSNFEQYYDFVVLWLF